MNKNGKIRIGRITYTNVWPIFYHFPMNGLEDQVEFISQVPTNLNQALVQGDIDISPISSFAYGESFDQYLLYPNFSVSAFGKVGSILLFHRKPLEEIINGNFVLPTTSATSVNLLKILMEKFYMGKPCYTYGVPSLHEMMSDADAALLIGDDAIRASWENHGYFVTDLSEEWMKWTGYGMSFAIWAIRKQVATAFPQLVETIYHAFLRSKELTMKAPQSMIRTAQSTIGGTEQYWKTYFSNLNYHFDSQQQQGLSLYFQYAKELGLLSHEVPIQMWNDNKVAQIEE